MQFTGPNAHQTILTLPTDERWKAVRKAVATAFSTTNMRANFPGNAQNVFCLHRCCYCCLLNEGPLLNCPNNKEWKIVHRELQCWLDMRGSCDDWCLVLSVCVCQTHNVLGVRFDSGPLVAGIRTACSQLIEVLAEMGPNKSVDMDNATCRESLDVIGASNTPRMSSFEACLGSLFEVVKLIGWSMHHYLG